MQYYDVIIVGAGIAGSGLAYNLKQQGYKGSVLVIDKEGVGANKGHNLRAVFDNVYDYYKLSYYPQFKGVKIGVFDEVVFTIDEPVYPMRYKESCKKLLKDSSVEFRLEQAIDTSKNVLYTNKVNYRFKYLIDCSGISVFLRKKFNFPKPFRFWIADTKVLENNENIDTDYLYYLFDNSGFVEEINPFKDVVIHGNWRYTKKPDISLIRPHDQLLCKKLLPKQKILDESYAIIPNTPLFPLAYKNYAFLGDSFGNSTTANGFGVNATLSSSELLAEAIKRENLKNYEKEWKKKFLSAYMFYLLPKFDLYHNSKLLSYIKNYPSYPDLIKLFARYKDKYAPFLKDPSYIMNVLKETNDIYPKRRLLFLLYYFFYIRLRYFMMDYFRI